MEEDEEVEVGIWEWECLYSCFWVCLVVVDDVDVGRKMKKIRRRRGEGVGRMGCLYRYWVVVVGGGGWPLVGW